MRLKVPVIMTMIGVLCHADSLNDQSFVPASPVLRSDVGLLSVNVQPVFIREKYWLHSVAFHMPCVDDVIKPGIIAMTNDMNYSTVSIMKMAHGIDLVSLHLESKERIIGPIKSLNQTHRIFLEKLRSVRKLYFEVMGSPVHLWGILSPTRCSVKNDNDIGEDAYHEAHNNSKRAKRELPLDRGGDKHNIINIEGSGHTFIFNHEGTKAHDPPLDVAALSIPLGSQDPVVDTLTTPTKGEGQMFMRISKIAQQEKEIDPQSCQITQNQRLKYLKCYFYQGNDESTCYTKHLKCNSSYSRSKRGLFDFIGDIQNKLFGIATDQQLKKLHTIMTDLNAEIAANSNEIKLLRNSTMTLSTLTSNALTNISQSVYAELDGLTSSLHTWAIGIEANIKRSEETNQETHLAISLTTSSITLHSYIHILNNIYTSLTDVRDYYSTLHTLVTSKEFPAMLSQEKYLDSLWGKITSSIPDYLSIPNALTKTKILQSNIYQMYATDNHLVILIRIPIILNPMDIKFWDPRSVPVIRGEVAYKVKIEEDILITNERNKEWATMNHIDYMTCMTRGNRVCEQMFIWSSFNHPNCHLSLHNHAPGSKHACLIHEFGIDKTDLPYAVYSDTRTWLFSTDKSSSEATLRCASTRGLPARVSSLTLPHLGLLQIPKQCSLELGSKRIHSPISEIGRSDYEVSEVLEGVDLQNEDDLISNLTIEVPFLLNMHIPRFEPQHHSDNTLFTRNIININELNQKMNSDKTLFDNEVTKLQSTVIKDEKSYNLSISSLSSFFGNFSLPHFIIPFPSLFNLVMVTWVSFLTWKMFFTQSPLTATGMAMSLLPGSSDKHQSFALSLSSHLDNSSNVTSSDAVHSCYKSNSMIWIPSICLVLMIVLHIHTRYIVRLYTRKTALRLGWVPVNQNNVQHVGENRLTVGVLLSFLSIFGRVLTRREMVIQVTTLPGSPDSWYVEKKSSVNDGSITGSYNRLSYAACFHINWNNICIRSHSHTDLDTCQDLPRDIKIDTEDIYHVTKYRVPWYWWEAKATAITSISISKYTDNSRLYVYTD